MIPDRLPSLVLLVGFWIPPAVVGIAVADLFNRSSKRVRPALIYTLLAILPWAGLQRGFFFNSTAFRRTYPAPRWIQGTHHQRRLRD